jgi:hypothetical protein
MPVFICREFLHDLINGQGEFPKRALEKTLGTTGKFVSDTNDHRYDGIEDAWIRYITRGNTAWRAIYIKKGENIYWYRAGVHSVEDRLPAPRNLTEDVVQHTELLNIQDHSINQNSKYLQTKRPRLLTTALSERCLLPHKEITLVSPDISHDLMHPSQLLGRLIQSAFSFGGRVTLITKPAANRVDQYNIFVSSYGIDLLFHDELNAKLYMFDVDKDNLTKEQKDAQNIAIIGSADLTNKRLNLNWPHSTDEELCYEISKDDMDDAYSYVLEISSQSYNLNALKAKQDATAR